MNPKITLTNPTDDELNAAVAEHVAGWTYQTFPNGACPHIKHWKNAKGEHTSIYMDGRFATSADAVLPWLNENLLYIERKDGRWLVGIDTWTTIVYGDALTFPRAACIALLRANGVEVVT